MTKLISDILIFFIPSYISLIGIVIAYSLITKKSLRDQIKKYILWSGLILLGVSIFVAILINSSNFFGDPNNAIRLQAELYTVKNDSDGSIYVRNIYEGDTLKSFDKYKIKVFCEQRSYLYIFQFDSQGKFSPLFPSSNIPIKNPLIPNAWFDFPSKNTAWYLDTNIGVETIAIFAYAEPVVNLEEKIENLVGASFSEDFKKRVQQPDVGHILRGMGGVKKIGENTTQILLENGKIEDIKTSIMANSKDKDFVYIVSFAHSS